MKFEDAARSAGTTYLRRPSEVLPAFVAESAYQVVVQPFTYGAILLAFFVLSGSGRIERVFEAFERLTRALQRAQNAPQGNVAAQEGVVEAYVEFGKALLGLATTEVIAIFVAAGVLTFLVGIVVRALVGAAKTHAARGAMTDGDPLVAAIGGARRDAVSFVALTVLQAALVLGPLLLVVAAAATAFFDPQLAGLLTAVALPIGGVLALVGWIVSVLALLFVPEAIAVDEVGLLGAIRKNAGFFAAEPLRTLGYLGVAVVTYLLAFGVGLVFQFLGMPRFPALVWLVVLGPLLGLLKMGVYVDAEPPHATRSAYDLAEMRSSLAGGARRAAGEFRDFVVYRAYFVLAALALFAVGGYGGWWASSDAGFELPSSERDALFGAFGNFPFEDAVNIAANNWLVAISHSFAGMAFGIPTVVNLLFNGFLIGALAGVTPMEFQVFAALIVPHGLVEIPALSVSGGLGLYLSWHAFRYYVGSIGTGALAEKVRSAFYVLVGLLPVFVVAALVETVVSPLVGKLVESML